MIPKFPWALKFQTAKSATDGTIEKSITYFLRVFKAISWGSIKIVTSTKGWIVLVLSSMSVLFL